MVNQDRCAEPAGALLDPERALCWMASRVEPIDESELSPLARAKDRILAKALVAPCDSPPFSCASMDGYAIHATDLASRRPLPVVGNARAGIPFTRPLTPGGCIRILTGAPVPEAAAAVVPQEEVRREGESIVLERALWSGEFIRSRGDDFRVGDTLLPAGRRLSAADLGLLATCGRFEIEVIRQPRVAVITSGDELRPAWQRLGPGQIHESNRSLLKALLQDLGVDTLDLGNCADDPRELGSLLEEAATTADAIVSAGGASVGDADHLIEAAAAKGQVEFWKVAIKPGKPFAFGRIGSCWLFGLPGNPVAVAVTFRQLVRPILLRLAGAEAVGVLRLRAKNLHPIEKLAGRLEYQRGNCWRDESGELVVTALPRQESHQLRSLAIANCLIVLPAAATTIQRGEPVEIELLDLSTSLRGSQPPATVTD